MGNEKGGPPLRGTVEERRSHYLSGDCAHGGVYVGGGLVLGHSGEGCLAWR